MFVDSVDNLSKWVEWLASRRSLSLDKLATRRGLALGKLWISIFVDFWFRLNNYELFGRIEVFVVI